MKIDTGLAKGAAIKSGIGMAFAAAAGCVEAVMHHVTGNFTTLVDAFAYVAQPANLAAAAALSIGAGVFIELAKRHNRAMDREQAAATGPVAPSAPKSQP